MNSFEYLMNKYSEVANNFDEQVQSIFNNNFSGLHNISREEYIRDYDEYAKLFGDEILFHANSNIDEDNRCFEKYEDWMINGN